MPLGDEQIERYSRQIILPEVGGVGQQRLLAAHVLVAGEGRAAPWVALYLAAAGVGRLTLAPPQAAVEARLAALNRDVRVFGAATAGPQSGRFDVVVCAGEGDLVALEQLASVPLVAVGASGVTVSLPGDLGGACPSCAARLVASRQGSPPGQAAGTVVLATLAVTEALKLILGLGVPLSGRRLDAALNQHVASCLPDCRRRVS